ncbi:MAG: ATP-binding cassette domain-containing protein [Actinomycetota bacterium]|nr:MAG: ATP-binding cassette domain-containing protein [Actinomycetota bacterium]
MAGSSVVTTATIKVEGLTKQFGHGPGAVTAVDDLSFEVAPGRVTGFLGPNGAGKTTTLRCLLGLVTPTRGTVEIGGVPYQEIPTPARVVGASLEASGFHPGRSARDHLRVICAASQLPESRADEVLQQVGLSDAARRRAGGYSLGMRQRLALAAALVGDPAVLLLDEPANGLDPEGIAWLRGFLRHLASQGRTVLVSSHVLSEVEQTVDDVIIVARGRLVRASSLAELTATTGSQVRVRSPQLDVLLPALGLASGDGQRIRRTANDTALIEGIPAAAVGAAALRAQAELHELVVVGNDLEEVFLSLTQGTGPTAAAPPGAAWPATAGAPTSDGSPA